MHGEAMQEQKLIRRGTVATVLFLGFVALGLFDDKLLGAIGSEALARSQQVFVYTVQIGIWLSGAAFLSSALNAVLWDRLVARATGRPVPRLIKDFFTAVIFLIAITGIIGIVFDQSV